MTTEDNKYFWKIERCFFQANLIKGGRYLDDAGKIINDYEDYYEDYNVGTLGLVFKLRKTAEMPDELSVNMQRIWMAYYGEESFKRAIEQAPRIIKNISKHIEVLLFQRFGFRVIFFKPMDEVQKYQKTLYSHIASDELKTAIGKEEAIYEINTNFRLALKEHIVNIKFMPIIVNQKPRSVADYTHNGMSVDIDFGITPESSKSKLGTNILGSFVEESSTRINLIFKDILAVILSKCEEKVVKHVNSL